MVILVVGSLLLGGGFLWWSNRTVERDTRIFISSNAADLPSVKVGLLLGTSRLLASGRENAYFNHRIDAAATLFKSGKITAVLVSGDNSTKSYNEPEDMQRALMEKGVPASRIFLDYAGLRTLDSVLRIRDIFGQTKFIVISQKFHNQRAVWLARQYGLEAYGYNAKDVNRYAGFKTKLREKFARAKAVLDVWFGTKPKFGGEKVMIP